VSPRYPQFGLPQARLLDEITARMPTPDEARTLAMGRGVPLLVQTRTGYAKDDKPRRHMISRMAADRVDVRYELEI
jgi:GntR family transcriptional regulator